MDDQLMSRLTDLFQRNAPLTIGGGVMLLLGMSCWILIALDPAEITGINRWIKPMKFFISIAILFWTMAWLGQYWQNQQAFRIYSWVLLITLSLEMFIIFIQAVRMERSHFNTTSALNGMLFSLMGILITMAVVSTAIICIPFIRQPRLIPDTLYWGILLGIFSFVFFSFQGGMMVARMAHTVGAADGGAGLPILNWSTTHGDLRIAHFLGIHSLQVFPLMGYLLQGRLSLFFLLIGLYLVMVFWILWYSLQGKSLFL